MKEYPEFLQKIDWKLLREQKVDLLSIINDLEEDSQYDTEEDKDIGAEWVDSLNGIINLIDSIQDYATDEMGLGDEVVFNLNPEEE